MKTSSYDMKPAEKVIQGVVETVPAIYFSKYLSEGQRVTLTRKQLEGLSKQLDSITGTLTACNESDIEVMLSFGEGDEESYPFFPGMPFEVLTDCFGAGLRFNCLFEKHINSNHIELKPYGNLEFFYRRKHLRSKKELWVSSVRSTKSLRTLRRVWKKHSELIQANEFIPELPPVSLQNVTLGAGGLQLDLEPPVIVPEFCLVYIALEDNGSLICALCESVWTVPSDKTGKQKTGFEFRNIIDSDRKRIDRFVKRMISIG